jgi:hypothetical protein
MARVTATRTTGERLARLSGGGQRPGRGGEGQEEGVALGVDLGPTVATERLAQDAAVGGQHLGILLRAERVQQLGRALDIGEPAGNRAGWKVSRNRSATA